MSLDKSIGTSVRILRTINRVSISKAAHLCGMSPNTFESCEEGKKEFLAAEIIDVCKAIKTNVSCLYSWVATVESLPSDDLKKIENSLYEMQIEVG